MAEQYFKKWVIIRGLGHYWATILQLRYSSGFGLSLLKAACSCYQRGLLFPEILHFSVVRRVFQWAQSAWQVRRSRAVWRGRTVCSEYWDHLQRTHCSGFRCISPKSVVLESCRIIRLQSNDMLRKEWEIRFQIDLEFLWALHWLYLPLNWLISPRWIHCCVLFPPTSSWLIIVTRSHVPW